MSLHLLSLVVVGIVNLDKLFLSILFYFLLFIKVVDILFSLSVYQIFSMFFIKLY